MSKTWLQRVAIRPEEADDLHFENNGCRPDAAAVIRVQPDLQPVPPLPYGPRKWGAFHLAGYWVAEAFGYQYQVASSALAAGLSPGLAIVAVFLGHLLVSFACAANGFVGAVYGINFPIFARASFGSRGTVVAILCRAMAAIVWFGTQTYQGGQCVQVMLRAIWPSFKDFPNHLPTSAQVTSAELLCFFIFFVIQLPLLWIHISKLRYLFMIKVIVMPIFGFVLFGWAVGAAKGFGPMLDVKSQSPQKVAFVFFSAMTSAIAPKATLALNICDFTRYAKSPKVVVWTNILSLSILVTLCAILGVIVTSATEKIYGVATWNPLQVAELWDNRAAAFFAAVCWALAVIATNISANSTAVGNDLAILFPKYVNIRRGQYICAVIGVASCPWVIQSSARSFTAFLGGYSIFLGPIAGIILSDFYILRHRTLDLPGLFGQGQTTPYWYSGGFNFRALVAFILAMVPSFPGFVARVNTSLNIPSGAEWPFSLVWPVGLVLGATVYLALSFAWPHQSDSYHRADSPTNPLSEEDAEHTVASSSTYSTKVYSL
ncbi:NCS1 nucleoside transporter family [Flagelloscypha sp. PMI_526]|nr:NCS1 nucleoside transporter family [Flagelloscypha sp. PMI_526]